MNGAGGPSGSSQDWSVAQRRTALEQAQAEGVDLLVVGGGITGAGVLRDAATRGLRALLVERDDFAGGTSSRSSKMIHGGFRYIAQGQLRLTREACRERDLLMKHNPLLVRPLPFLFPAFAHSKVRWWQVRAGLIIYAALANFRRSARSRALSPAEIRDYAPLLDQRGMLGACLYQDGQVDDVRLVLESLKAARWLGAEAVSHAEVREFRYQGKRIQTVRVRDRLEDRSFDIPAGVVVNAAGPGVEAVRGLSHSDSRWQLRPAKGVHLVIPRERLPVAGAVVLEAPDGRLMFLSPWDEVVLIGTTDSFCDDIDEPRVHLAEVQYLLAAVNRSFPRAALTLKDLRAVFAGVRPLLAAGDADTPPSSVSREHQIDENPSGLISVAGGKLTTYRAMGEALVDRALKWLTPERRAAAGPSRSASLALRDDDFDHAALESRLQQKFEVSAFRAAYLVRTYGRSAEELIEEAAPALRDGIGSSRYSYAEIPWAFRREAAVTLCDVLERRLRLPIFAENQGLAELPRIATIAAEAAGWDDVRKQAELAAYVDGSRRRYRIAARSDVASAAA